MNECVFCKIIEGKIPSKKVFENDSIVAINDISPQAPVHVLFIPKVHVESLSHIQDFNLLAEMFKALVQVSDQLGLKDKGFRSVINTGREGGQTVFHLHLHLLAGSQLSPRMS